VVEDFTACFNGLTANRRGATIYRQHTAAASRRPRHPRQVVNPIRQERRIRHKLPYDVALSWQPFICHFDPIFVAGKWARSAAGGAVSLSSNSSAMLQRPAQ
jgi:hypothetical protein